MKKAVASGSRARLVRYLDEVRVVARSLDFEWVDASEIIGAFLGSISELKDSAHEDFFTAEAALALSLTRGCVAGCMPAWLPVYLLRLYGRMPPIHAMEAALTCRIVSAMGMALSVLRSRTSDDVYTYTVFLRLLAAPDFQARLLAMAARPHSAEDASHAVIVGIVNTALFAIHKAMPACLSYAGVRAAAASTLLFADEALKSIGVDPNDPVFEQTSVEPLSSRKCSSLGKLRGRLFELCCLLLEDPDVHRKKKSQLRALLQSSEPPESLSAIARVLATRVP
jgi:hypothetical protein